MGSSSMTVTSLHTKYHPPPERSSDLLGGDTLVFRGRLEACRPWNPSFQTTLSANPDPPIRLQLLCERAPATGRARCALRAIGGSSRSNIQICHLQRTVVAEAKATLAKVRVDENLVARSELAVSPIHDEADRN